ncbi:hypothetical protein J6590_069172 [Homalodisca vitripennis]|nr:hypothetical protein J6590_069172 [Homalodisca vitripennis]
MEVIVHTCWKYGSYLRPSASMPLCLHFMGDDGQVPGGTTGQSTDTDTPRHEELQPGKEGLCQYQPSDKHHEASNQDEEFALHGSDTTSDYLRGSSMVPPHLQVRSEKTVRCPERLSGGPLGCSGS